MESYAKGANNEIWSNPTWFLINDEGTPGKFGANFMIDASEFTTMLRNHFYNDHEVRASFLVMTRFNLFYSLMFAKQIFSQKFTSFIAKMHQSTANYLMNFDKSSF